MTLARGGLLLFVLFASTMAAQDFGPDACVSGFVWREAFPGDHACVDPTVRAQAATDNQLASGRRQPGGGQFGLDTCRAGFVWREARPEDRVCVTAQTRDQTANDNRAAASRRVRAQVTVAPAAQLARGATAARGTRAAIARGAVTPTVTLPPGFQQPPARPTSGAPTKRGFDDDGNPYIEDTLPDGSRRRQQQDGVTVIRPDGTSQPYPNMTLKANAQPPTPPELPEDPARGLNWVNFHNGQLLDLISILVNFDKDQLAQFHRGEDKKAGADPFKQIKYRMDVLDVLAKP
jgi:hypothetical protein